MSQILFSVIDILLVTQRGGPHNLEGMFHCVCLERHKFYDMKSVGKSTVDCWKQTSSRIFNPNISRSSGEVSSFISSWIWQHDNIHHTVL